MQLPEPEKPSWFVLNSYTRNEHKVEDYLSQVENLQFFIPKRYALRNYYGRVKRELVPLIPGMVFVRDVYDKVQQLQKDVSFLGFATLSDGVRRMPMKVPDYQMDNFIRVVQHFEENLTYFRPDELQLNKGTYVKIIGWSEELINKFAEILVKEEPAFNVDLKQERLNALMQYVDEVEEIVPNVVEEIVEACCCEPQEPVEQPVVADVQYAVGLYQRGQR